MITLIILYPFMFYFGGWWAFVPIILNEVVTFWLNQCRKKD